MSGTEWTSGKVNNALLFDGTDDYVNIAGPNEGGAFTGFSAACWIRQSDSVGAAERIICAANNLSDTKRFRFSYDNNSNLVIDTLLVVG